MIYETEIKIKEFSVYVEFDTETEEFSYTIKQRKQSNEKRENKEKSNEQTNRTTDRNSNGGNAEPKSDRTDSDELFA